MALLEIIHFCMKNFFPLIIGLFGVGFVIAFHEFGHFIFGKLFGVSIPTFSIGFGPQLIKQKIGSTSFSLSLIPMGGYVEAEVGDYSNPKPGTIAAIAYWQKMLIIIGGIACNFIFAYLVFVGLSMTGIPSNPFFAGENKHRIEKIEAGSSAEIAGIQPGDRILKIADMSLESDLKQLLETLKGLANTDTVLTIERNGEILEKPITIGSRTVKDKEIGSLGVQFGFESTPAVGFMQALQQGFTITKTITINTIAGFSRVFAQRSTDGLAGPLMMISLSVQTAGHSTALFFLFLAFISISLGVLNLIPLPILDGGQAVTYTLEALLGRSLHEKTLEYVHYTCWIVMLLLFAYLTFKDVIAMWL